MSYEGFSQILCANGHLRELDCYQDNGDLSEVGPCSCGAPYVYRHMVDETNGIEIDNPATLRYPFEVDNPEEVMTCNLGHDHIVVEKTYKIPEQKA